jgi:hypothetical protein
MRRILLLVGSFLVVSAAAADAQRTTATIRGTVRDASQAVVPGATVTAANPDTGLTRTSVTNAEGTYSVPDLPVGRYNVTVELSGFKTATRTGVPLRVADDFLIDFVLEAGALSEVISVEASSTPVKLLGGDVSGVVTGQQVRELPLNGRNFLQLATLMPGVSAPDFLNVKDKGLLGGSDLSVSGNDVTANMWTVDGANNNDVGSNRTILVYPSLEAIEEFKILRNSYGPEFGGASGAQVNIVTRGGTNQFHGSALYSGRNDAFNAKDYFLKKNRQEKADLSRHDFGGFLGGPILRDKIHFFGGMEWNLEDRGHPRTAFVPTEAERNGDFSGARIPGCSGPIPVDPLTGQPFPGNRIPANRLSPAGRALLQLYALPNVTPTAGSCNNWVTSVTTPIDSSTAHGRVDWTMSNISRLMVRYTQDSWENGAPNLQSNLWGDDPFPAVDSNWSQPSRSFIASLNSTLGTNATNTFQFSYSANKIEITRGGENAELNASIVSAFQPIFPVNQKQHGQDIGHPVWWGGGGYPALWNEAPFLNNQDLFVLKDDYTRVFGTHFVKAGALFSTNAKNEDTIGNGSFEHSAFWGGAGLTPNGFDNTGNVLADILLRDMTFGFTEINVGRQSEQRWRDMEFYVADSWQATSRLTIDLGFRYSIFYNMVDAEDKITSFVPSLFDPALGNDPCNGLLQPPGTNWCREAGARGGADAPNRSLMEQDFNNIAPRVGFAWDVFGDGKTALRGGLGQFFLRERLTPGLTIALNPPFAVSLFGVRRFDTTAEPCPGCFGTGSLGTPTRGREVDQRTPNSWQWNLTAQREVWRNSTIEVGYVGNYGYDMLRNNVVNQVLNGDLNRNGMDDRLEFVLTSGGNAALRQFGVFGNQNIGVWDHSGRSRYHSLQTQFITRFGRGSQFQTSYTLSRSRANLALTDSGNLAANSARLDNQNPDADWGRPETGRTHIYNASLVWLLPSLENRTPAVRGVLGDWELATIVGAGSGQPFTAYVGGLPGLNGGPSGTGFTDNQRPNRTSEPCRADGALDEQIINPLAYTIEGFQLGTIGNAKRGDCTGPGYFFTDVGIYKNFALTDRVKLQFRWDIFNVFNNVNFLFQGLDSDMNPSAVTLDAARTQIVSATIPSNFGQATRTRDPLQMQFGFKLLW